MSEEWDNRSDQEREGQAFGSGYEAGYEAAREQWEATRDTYETPTTYDSGGGFEGGFEAGGLGGVFPGLADWSPFGDASTQGDTESSSRHSGWGDSDDSSSGRQELMDEKAELLEQKMALLEQKEELLDEREKLLDERGDKDDEEDGQGGRRPRLRLPGSGDNEPRRRRR